MSSNNSLRMKSILIYQWLVMYRYGHVNSFYQHKLKIYIDIITKYAPLMHRLIFVGDWSIRRIAFPIKCSCRIWWIRIMWFRVHGEIWRSTLERDKCASIWKYMLSQYKPNVSSMSIQKHHSNPIVHKVKPQDGITRHLSI